MDDGELNMDSFVDIVANTVGIVIILTMLTIARIDKRNLEVDTDLRLKMDQLTEHQESMSKIAGGIMGASKGLVASGSDLGIKVLNLADLDGETELEKATSLLNRMAEIQKKSADLKDDLDLAASRRDAMEVRHAKASQSLTSLRAKKKRLTSAMGLRKKAEAQLVTDVPDLDMGEFQRASLTSMQQEVKQLGDKIVSLERQAEMGKEEFRRLQKEVEDLRKRKAAVDDELAGLREVTNLDITIDGPFDRSGMMPVLMECYVKPSPDGGSGELRVRVFSPGVEAPPEGEFYRDIAKEDSEFRKSLAEQTEEFKKTHKLHFIVHPDAFAAFHKARTIAREEGWSVDWNPVEKGAGLKLGAVSAR